MSRNAWEEGTLIIPAKAWKPLRDALCKAYNDQQARTLAFALRLHALVLEHKKTCKRGTFTVSAALEALRQKHPRMFDDAEARGDLYRVSNALCGRDANDRIDRKTLRLPKKKDFPLAVSTKTTYYDVAGEASIGLDHAKRELTWSVPENNHAVERAHEAFMGRTLFALLDKVEWTRGTGGELTGNDEYNRDDRYPGGGGNYVTRSYRPLTAKEKQARSCASRSAYGSGYGGNFRRY